MYFKGCSGSKSVPTWLAPEGGQKGTLREVAGQNPVLLGWPPKGGKKVGNLRFHHFTI